MSPPGSGDESSPAPGDWAGIEVSGSGSVDLAWTNVAHASQGLNGTTSGSVSVTDGTWAEFSSGGINVFAGPVTVENTSVTNSGSRPAFWVHSEELDLDRVSGNSATGGIAGFYVSGKVSSSSRWQAQLIPWLISGCGYGLMISEGVTVTLEPGVVLKGSSDNFQGCNAYSVPLRVEGSLVAAGTSKSPVTFTSLLDDSVGGDTNGDGCLPAFLVSTWAQHVVAQAPGVAVVHDF